MASSPQVAVTDHLVQKHVVHWLKWVCLYAQDAGIIVTLLHSFLSKPMRLEIVKLLNKISTHLQTCRVCPVQKRKGQVKRQRQTSPIKPTAVLFNGGVLKI